VTLPPHRVPPCSLAVLIATGTYTVKVDDAADAKISSPKL